MTGPLFLTQHLFYGAAAATLMGLGLGAWLEPTVPYRDPDPYANVVLNLPQDDAYASYGLTSSGWSSMAPPAVAPTPAAWSEEVFNLEEARKLFTHQAEPERIRPIAFNDAPPPMADVTPAPTPVSVSVPATPPAHNWPSETGDILNIGGEAPAPQAPPEPAAPPTPADAPAPPSASA